MSLFLYGILYLKIKGQNTVSSTWLPWGKKTGTDRRNHTFLYFSLICFILNIAYLYFLADRDTKHRFDHWTLKMLMGAGVENWFIL